MNIKGSRWTDNYNIGTGRRNEKFVIDDFQTKSFLLFQIYGQIKQRRFFNLLCTPTTADWLQLLLPVNTRK